MKADFERRPWKAVLVGSDRERVVTILEHVARTVNAQASVLCNAASDSSLAGGTAGIAVFAGYIHQWRPELMNRELVDTLLAHAREVVEGRPPDRSLFLGTVGVAWAIEHLSASTASAKSKSFCETLDQLIERGVQERSKWTKQFDLLTGLVGVGVYLLERPVTARTTRALELVVDAILRAAERPLPSQLTWRADAQFNPSKTTLYGEREGDCYNLGVPHGVPGVIAFLARVSVRHGGVLVPLRQSVNWLLAQRHSATFPCFGTAVGITPPIWLQPGWCYGDLGIAVTLATAATATRDQELLAVSHDLGTLVAEQTKEGTLDTGLCHGSAGNAHLLLRMFQYTGDTRFRDAASIWINRVVNRWRPDDAGGFAGFRSTLPDQPAGSVGFLRGCIGTSLSLLATVSDTEPSWDRVLLSSF